MIWKFHYIKSNEGGVHLKQLLEYEFEFVQKLIPVLSRDGSFMQYEPQDKYSKKEDSQLNKHGHGAFCRFSISPKWSGVSGVYAFYIDNELKYIGQCLDFAQRFNTGYGVISPRCCYIGGQSTNCKINKVVLEANNNGQSVELYFFMTPDYHVIEKQLIQYYKPILNTMLKEEGRTSHIKDDVSASKKPSRNKGIQTMDTVKMKNPSTLEVRQFISQILQQEKNNNKNQAVIRSGEIHKLLGMTNSMPTVCQAMRSLDEFRDYDIIEEPAKGNGSRLVFRYKL